MDTNGVQQKWNQVKEDAQVWWGELVDDTTLEVEGNWEKLEAKLEEQKGLTKEAAQEEREKFQQAQAKFAQKTAEQKEEIVAKWNKLTQEDLAEAGESLKGFAGKIQKSYQIAQEEAQQKVKEFASSL